MEKKKSHVKYFVLLGLLLAIVIAVIIVSIWVKSGENTTANDISSDNIYSASRFFCHVYFPDKWMTDSDESKFSMDGSTGLFLKLYPYTETAAENISEDAESTPEPVKNEVPGVRVSFFYQENPEYFTDEEDTAPTDESAPTPSPYPLETACESAIKMMKEVYLPTKASSGGPDYNFSAASDVKGKDITYKQYTYSYREASGQVRKGKMSVCTRAMCYYIIAYEAYDELYAHYEADYDSMIQNFEYSVFEY